MSCVLQRGRVHPRAATALHAGRAEAGAERHRGQAPGVQVVDGDRKQRLEIETRASIYVGVFVGSVS